jgi:hypothetical protein
MTTREMISEAYKANTSILYLGLVGKDFIAMN